MDIKDSKDGNAKNGLTQQEALAKAEALELEAAKIRAENNLDPLLAFPSLEGAPGGFHVDRSRYFWVGFEIMKMDYQGAKDFLRSADFQVWNLYVQLAKQQEERKRLAAAPGGIRGLVGKLVGGR